MSTELKTTEQDIEVMAETPTEMRDANAQLMEWCERKIAALSGQHAELKEAEANAVEHKWKSSTLRKQAGLMSKRIAYYAKIRLALEAGYYIIPNFPVSAFAIRTDKAKPLKLMTIRHWDRHEQHAMGLGTGEGEYKNPFPQVWQRDVTSAEDRAKNKKTIQYEAEEWEEVEFPITMSKPRIMEATSRAMALKIFDDLCILPAARIKGDPMIIARIKDPRSTKYNAKHISFILAWALDTRTL